MNIFLSILSHFMLFLSMILGLAGCTGYIVRIGIDEYTYSGDRIFPVMDLLAYGGLIGCGVLSFLLIITPLRFHLSPAIMSFLVKTGASVFTITGIIGCFLGAGGLVARIVFGPDPDSDSTLFRIVLRAFIGGFTFYGLSLGMLLIPQINASLDKNFISIWFPFFSHQVLFAGIVCGLFGLAGFIRSIFGNLDMDKENYRNIIILFFGGFSCMALSFFSLFFTPMQQYLNKSLTGAIFPVIAIILLTLGVVCGIMFFIGFFWRILAGGSSVMESTFRRMHALLFASLLVFILSILLVLVTPLKDHMTMKAKNPLPDREKVLPKK